MVKRRMGVLAVALWCPRGGVALGEDKAKSVRVKVDDKDVTVNISEASKTELMKFAGVGAGAESADAAGADDAGIPRAEERPGLWTTPTVHPSGSRGRDATAPRRWCCRRCS